jgi:GGDEF domain-containing protein
MMRNCHQRRRGLMINTDDIDRWLDRVRRTYRCQPVRSFESDLTDGRWMWVTETTRPDGWVFVVLVDITPLKVNEATLRRSRDDALIAAMTDPLTSLYNRRYIFRRLDDLLCTTRKMRIPLAVAMLDLDHFKRVNDVHGHAVGDGVLQHFAQQMRKHLRPLDAVGRIGGEEFLMLLPNADAIALLRAAGVSPVVMVELFERLAAQRGAAGDRPGPDLGIALASHPADAERIARFREAAAR